MRLPVPEPFGVTADPEIYMPRAATERALAELERALLAGELPVVLTGPAGIGKTLLLRVAERRLTGRVRCVYVAYAALAPVELCSWILGLMGESAPATGDAEAALLAAAHASAQVGTPLVLLIDDASAVPAETAERLQSLAAGSRGALQVVAADMDDAACEPWVARFGTRVERVRLDAPMNAAETALYVRARLERGGASVEDRGRLDAWAIDRIFRRSGGIPRAVQALASEFLRVGEAALPREALEALIAREEAGEMAAHMAATVRAREVLSAEGRRPEAAEERLEAPRPAAPAPPSVLPSPPEPTPVSPVVRPAASPAPSPSSQESTAREALPKVLGATSLPTERLSALPREHVPTSPAVSQRHSMAPSIAKRVPSTEPPIRGSLGRRVLLGALLLGGVIGLAMLYPRNRPEIREAPAPVPDTSRGAEAPPEPSATFPSDVAAPETLPKEPEPPPASRVESDQSASPESVKAEASRPPAEAPAVAEVPVAAIPVHINATPWATIEVDGVNVGETPIAAVPLAPGNHVFKARMPDGRILEKTVRIGGETRYVTFQ